MESVNRRVTDWSLRGVPGNIGIRNEYSYSINHRISFFCFQELALYVPLVAASTNKASKKLRSFFKACAHLINPRETLIWKIDLLSNEYT